MAENFSVIVWHEDTDAAGIVYYANYFKFTERARSAILMRAGLSQRDWLRELGVIFVVRSVRARWHASARLHDQLRVRTEPVAQRKTALTLRQTVWRSGVLLVDMTVELAALKANGRPCAVPEKARQAFRTHGNV